MENYKLNMLHVTNLPIVFYTNGKQLTSLNRMNEAVFKTQTDDWLSFGF